jgi:phospholipid transport system substrate-binding protein
MLHMHCAISQVARAGKVVIMVSFKYVVAITFAMALFIATSPAFSVEVAPDDMVKSIAQDVQQAIRGDKTLQAGDPHKLAELAETKVVPHFDFRRMTRSAMARNWRLATPAQQEQLTLEFKTLLVSTYSKALVTYKDRSMDFRLLRPDPAASEVTVRSQIQHSSEVDQSYQAPTVIDYDLEKSPEGWKIFDVKVDGVSLVVTYRDTFDDQVRSGGVDGLISSLARKNQANLSHYKVVKS